MELLGNLTLDDLAPQEAAFKLADFPDKTFTLKRFTMNDRIFLNHRWPDTKQVQAIFSELKLEEISEIAWRLLKEKDAFENNIEKFRDSIVSMRDIHALITATLTTIGLSEPVIKTMAGELDAPKTKPSKAKKKKRIGRR